MRRVSIILIAAIFAISLKAQVTFFINGAPMRAFVDNNTMTATLMDVDYEIKDTKFPFKRHPRSFAGVQDGRLEIPEVIEIGGDEYVITRIGRGAFAGYNNIKSVFVPTTVTAIDEYAFFDSTIEEAYLSGTLDTIGKRAFGKCEDLKFISIPDGVNISKDAFSESKKLVYNRITRSDVNANQIAQARPQTTKTTPARATKEQVSPMRPMVISDVDKDLPEAKKPNDDTFVLIIANEDYEDGVETVPYAKNDGNSFKNYCITTLGIPSKKVMLVENATLAKMRNAFDYVNSYGKTTEGQKNIIVYYAGHAVPDEGTLQPFLLPVDAGAKNPTTNGYSLKDVYTMLGKTPSKNIVVFLDACFSGATRDDKMLASGGRGVAIAPRKETVPPNAIVFSASQGNETAHAYEEQGHGLFSYYLLKKLKESEGNVTFGELADYLKRTVGEESLLVNFKGQTPTVTTGTAVKEWRKKKLVY